MKAPQNLVPEKHGLWIRVVVSIRTDRMGGESFFGGQINRRGGGNTLLKQKGNYAMQSEILAVDLISPTLSYSAGNDLQDRVISG